jgi:8-oxo-dGTP pyrophosphatase MutT (NUDIX family)
MTLCDFPFQEDALVQALRPLLHSNGGRPQENDGFSPSAVLLPLFRKEGEYHILLNKRTDLVEHHKGEICFPGGMQDPQDADHVATALREAQEELGIDPSHVEILGELEPVSTVITNIIIRPVVGFIPFPYPFKLSAAEVAETLEVPVSTLLDPAALRVEPSTGRGIRYSYLHQSHVIWGATARILTQLVVLLAQALKKEVPWSSQHPDSPR